MRPPSLEWIEICIRTIGAESDSQTIPAGSPPDGVGVAAGVATGVGVGVTVGGDAEEPHWTSTASAAAQASTTSE